MSLEQTSSMVNFKRVKKKELFYLSSKDLRFWFMNNGLDVLSLAVHFIWQECMVEEINLFTRGGGRKTKVRVSVLMSPLNACPL